MTRLPQHLELDDRLRFTLTGEKCQVVETTNDSKTLRWPSGLRNEYAHSDGIWQHFKLQQ